MSGIISWRGFDCATCPLTPKSADTRTFPSCLLAQAELLQTLAPVLVSMSLLEISPLISALTAPYNLQGSTIVMSTFGSE